MSHLRGKFARFVAFLALIAGLVGASMPSFAAPPPIDSRHGSMPIHAAMDCGAGGHREAPSHHNIPGAADCCVVGVCAALNLVLPAAPSGIARSALPGVPDYDLPALLPPAGIVAAPIPHPPKPLA